MSSYFSLFVIIIITLLYFIKFKPNLSIDIVNSPSFETEYIELTKKQMFYLCIYVSFIIISQISTNIQSISSTCNGSLAANIGQGFFVTIIIWWLFIIIVALLIVFPGWKSAFSDVIGYFAVSGEANSVLTKLLVNTNIQELINNDKIDKPQKDALQKSAEAIIKLCGNTSIMINQIVPENFSEYWNMLTPLMKAEYQNPENPEVNTLKEQLLSVVVTRDNIGEGLWYIYTAVLLNSMVQYNLATRGCIKTVAEMTEEEAAFKANEAAEIQSQQTANQQVYSS